MAQLSAYELQRLANIEENNAKLRALGLADSILAPPVRRPKAVRKKPKVKRNQPSASAPDTVLACRRRKSPRLLGAPSGPSEDAEGGVVEADDEEVAYERPAKQEKPPDKFGHIEGFLVGSGWEMRTGACEDLVHRATVAGIVGTPERGCFSIVLNGGYADDVDHGDALTYTGSGGRNLKGTASNPKNLRTGPATKDQTLEGKEGRYNAALHKTFELGEPVRVLRGYKLDSPWAPLGLDCGGDCNYVSQRESKPSNPAGSTPAYED